MKINRSSKDEKIRFRLHREVVFLSFLSLLILFLTEPVAAKGESPSTFDISLFDIRYSPPPPDSCPDLQIDSIRVLEYKKKCYVVEYTLSNKGTAPAPLFGAKRKLTDNIILRAYFSGDRRVNRGDAEAGAAYIKKGTGILLPGESYTGLIEVDRRLETNYISIVLLQVDAFSTLRECDETNNVGWMILD